jgi:hypothetical protein
MPAAFLVLRHPVGGLPKSEVLIAFGMGVGLARQDKGATVV